MIGENEEDEVEEILNPFKTKYSRSSKYKRKRYLNNAFIQSNRNDKKTSFFKVPAPKKKIKTNLLKLNQSVNNPIEISIENDSINNDSLSSTSNNIHEERSDDVVLNGNIHEKTKTFNESTDKILHITNLDRSKNDEDSPRYDNHSFDKLVPFNTNPTEPLENDLFHHNTDEASENVKNH